MTNLSRRSAASVLIEIVHASGQLADGMAAAALAKAEQWEGFLRSSSGSGRGGSELTPTEAAAEAMLARADNGAGARAQFCADLVRVRDLLQSLEARAREWTDTSPPKDPPAECELCLSHAGVSVKLYRRFRGEHDDRKVGRCSWHDDFLGSWGEDAVEEETRAHLANPGRGNRISEAMVRRNHPEAYAARHGRAVASEGSIAGVAAAVEAFAGAHGATGVWKDRTA